jgi:TolA-binding protein
MDLTIIIPTRNRQNSVFECVKALEHNDAEIIVVDDASDEAVVLAADAARVIRHNRHRGRGACINTGLQAATRDLVLIINDDIYAAPDMVVRLVHEFYTHNSPRLCFTPRVTWDPDVTSTLTMKWIESACKFSSPMLLSRAFVTENGGYDEDFVQGLEDTEFQMRLRERGGLEIRRVDEAAGFQNNVIKVHQLIGTEFRAGASALLLSSKFPQYMPQIEDTELLRKNEARAGDAAAAVEDLVLMEQAAPAELPAGVSELYAHVCRHYFLHGVFEALKDIGGTRPKRKPSSTVGIYRQASHLEQMGELDEARRLFRLVLHRSDEQYWDGAEYHLGCIEMALQNPEAAHGHFMQCLRLNPAHSKARRMLYKPAHYREVESNVFLRIDSQGPAKVLFIVFGDLGHVINSFPVVAALRQKFRCETAWLTAPQYAELVRWSMVGEIHETKTPGVLPWDWIHAQGFTHVFFPEPGANQEEWEQSGLHAMDFIAKKCGVDAETRRPQMQIDARVAAEAEQFLKEHGLRPGGFVTVSDGGGTGRHWPNSNVMLLAEQIDLPVVVLGKMGGEAVPGTIPCEDKSLDVMAEIISRSGFYLGPAHGTSWLAIPTDTPMGLFFDPQGSQNDPDAFRYWRLEGTSDLRLWSIYTNLRAVVDHIEAGILNRSKEACSGGL